MTPALIAVLVAGGLGAGARFALDWWVAQRIPTRVPLGTFVVNVSGSLLLGLLVGWVSAHDLPQGMTAILATGLLGGYTTFSAAAVEAVRLAEASRAGSLAVVHAVGMLILGLASAVLGLWLTS